MEQRRKKWLFGTQEWQADTAVAFLTEKRVSHQWEDTQSSVEHVPVADIYMKNHQGSGGGGGTTDSLLRLVGKLCLETNHL